MADTTPDHPSYAETLSALHYHLSLQVQLTINNGIEIKPSQHDPHNMILYRIATANPGTADFAESLFELKLDEPKVVAEHIQQAINILKRRLEYLETDPEHGTDEGVFRKEMQGLSTGDLEYHYARLDKLRDAKIEETEELRAEMVQLGRKGEDLETIGERGEEVEKHKYGPNKVRGYDWAELKALKEEGKRLHEAEKKRFGDEHRETSVQLIRVDEKLKMLREEFERRNIEPPKNDQDQDFHGATATGVVWVEGEREFDDDDNETSSNQSSGMIDEEADVLRPATNDDEITHANQNDANGGDGDDHHESSDARGIVEASGAREATSHSSPTSGGTPARQSGSETSTSKQPFDTGDEQVDDVLKVFGKLDIKPN